MKISALVLSLSIMTPALGAAETRYGSFVYDDRLPSTLFLTGEIRQKDSFELRRALRDHDIQIVIMGSAGGSLYEGLQMGSILRDKGVSTYVPLGVNCESSCANMFFGGAKRKAEGQLGVHQFFSGDRDRSVQLGQTQASAQYTTADIIGIMNDLGAPAFVYEKMFGTTQMYYFPEDEKRRLDLNADDAEFIELQQKSIKFISDNPKIVDRPAEETTTEPAVASAPATPQSPSRGTARPPSPSRASPPSTFSNTDFFGADLYVSGIRGVSQSTCQQACRDDSSCAAWSYVHASRWCWPKAAVSNLSYGEGITSGVEDWAKVDTAIFDRPFFEITATDLMGNDLLPRGLSNTTLDECSDACQASSSCAAFTWVGQKNICFPKYAVGAPSKLSGAISGIKR
jgi:hypothetical protein